MSYIWEHKELTEADQSIALSLSNSLGINPVMGTLLVNRGIRTEEEARRFFRPQLTHLLDPFLFEDMQKAVDRLNEALGKKERILVYGDYDVDGCTAVALVYRFLQQYYSNIDYYIPSRNEEGYGVSLEEITYAKELGIDFIICDHHVPDPVLPPAIAILNAKKEDSTYPYKDLCGCGVGFKLMQGFAISNGIEFCNLIPLLDLCAISIASDIVPIMGENRILAHHGLRQLNQNPSVGVKALIDICGLTGKDLSLNDVIFKIGPRINASGRMQNGKEAVSLLIEKNPRLAKEKAATINEYNEQRKDLDKAMTEEANQIVASLDHQHEHKAIVLYNEEWHRGVIGIVASRLTEIYFRPAVVLTRTDDIVTGSARSVAGFDVYSAIDSCRDLLENFGGHTYAAGLSLKVENVPEFKRRFEEYVDKYILPEQTNAVLTYEAKIDFKDVNFRFYADLRRFSPYGPENPKPIFCTEQVYDYGTSRVVGREQEHIKLELVDSKSSRVMNGIAFGQSSQARYIKTKQAFDIVYSLEENSHKHGEVQLQIEDIKPAL